MANDRRLAARRAIIVAQRADAALTALVPAARIFGPQPPANPTWPFGKSGAPIAAPDRATGMDGTRVLITMHWFAEGPGDDAVSAIAAASAKALDGAELVTDDGEIASVTWTGGITLQDPEVASGWHATSDFEVIVDSPS